MSKSFLLTAFFILTGLVSLLAFLLRDATLLPENPAGEVARTAISIWERGEIPRERYQQLYNLLIEKSRAESNTRFWQDVFALGAEGQLLPKHCLLISIMAAPFYGLFGITGFWIFGELTLLLLFVGLYRCLREQLSEQTVVVTLFLFGCGTPIFLNGFGLSYDLLGVAFVVSGASSLKSHPAFGAFLIALSAMTRLSLLAFGLLPLCWLALTQLPRVNFLARAAVGFLLGLIPLLVLNRLMWGDPLTFAYDRLPQFLDGRVILDREHFVSAEILFSDWFAKLFNLRSGLLLYNPVLILLPISVIKQLGTRTQAFTLSLTAICIGYILLMFSYSFWIESGPGNRFCLPAVVLLMIPIGQGVQSWRDRLSRS